MPSKNVRLQKVRRVLRVSQREGLEILVYGVRDENFILLDAWTSSGVHVYHLPIEGTEEQALDLLGLSEGGEDE